MVLPLFRMQLVSGIHLVETDWMNIRFTDEK
jgi:hypothetical protein